MIDITAQAFREAAAQAQRFDYPAWADLLLAAAEQREQLEALQLWQKEQQVISEPSSDLRWVRAQRDEAERKLFEQCEAAQVRIGVLMQQRHEAEQQIATLTAELIDARHRIMELELEKK